MVASSTFVCLSCLQAAEADALLSNVTPAAGASAVDAARPTLLRAQLALEAGNVSAALGLMQQGLPQELRMRPAVVATRVALLEQVGCVGQVLCRLWKVYVFMTGVGIIGMLFVLCIGVL
jgi:hypothetical protein